MNGRQYTQCFREIISNDDFIRCRIQRLVPGRLQPEVDGQQVPFVECDRLTGDCLNGVVTWRGKRDISDIGDTVAIRIKMCQAKVFTYRM